jgi:hypothetical protein
MDMPKLSGRDRLADLEERQRKVTEEVEIARRDLRGKCLDQLKDLPVEKLGDREFRDLVSHAIRVGSPGALTALKALPDMKA